MAGERLSEGQADPAAFQALTALLQLETQLRRAADLKALQFLIVNETRRVLTYRQAILLTAKDGFREVQAEAASSIAVIDRQAPMIQWLERALPRLLDDTAARSACRVSFDEATEDIASGWHEYSLPYAAWMPLLSPHGVLVGGVWLARESPWNDAELLLLGRLGEVCAHCWLALTGNRPQRRLSFNRTAWLRGAALLTLIALFPARMTTLAPAEVVAQEPFIVSAPLDGVIASIEVEPNQSVAVGQPLLRFDDTVLRNESEVASQGLAVAASEHLRAVQGGFHDPRAAADAALLRAKAELAAAERDFALEMLEKVEVKAARAGVVLFNNKDDWIGRPVRTGERIMEIADPHKLRLRIALPVKDAMFLETGAEALVFLDADPLHPLQARVTHAAYRAETTADGSLTYRLDAEFAQAEKQDRLPRIGERGVAKIYGERAPLAFYLLRRPFVAFRQYLGI